MSVRPPVVPDEARCARRPAPSCSFAARVGAIAGLAGFAGLVLLAGPPAQAAEGAVAPKAAATTAPVVPARPAKQSRIVLPPTPLHPLARLGLSRTYSGTPVDAATWHVDNARTGWNATEKDLTPASVASGNFGLLATLNVDGDVLAEPLVVTHIRMKDGTLHDLLVVATDNNSVYAFDARTYAPLWQVNLGQAQDPADVGCDDVSTRYGISATPGVKRSQETGHLYVVDAIEPTKNEFHTRLHRLDLATGLDSVPPAEINPTTTMTNGSTLVFDAQHQWARAGLAVSKGNVYVSIGSHCDLNPVYSSGWMLRYDTQNLTPMATFSTVLTPGGIDLAGIWMSGAAPAVDDTDGSLYAVTGNGTFTRSGKDWGTSVIRVNPQAHRVMDFFTPVNQQSLSDRDLDFGSGGVMLVPNVPGQVAPPMAVAMGKDATLFLLDRSNLGHQRANDSGALQSMSLKPAGWNFWGNPAWWLSPTGGIVYYQINDDVLRGFTLSTGAAPMLTQALQGSSVAALGGSTPVVSSDGSTPGTGVVWLVKRNPLMLEAYDAEKLGDPIYTATAGQWTAGRPYLVPTVANGRVYVGASCTVKVFGLVK